MSMSIIAFITLLQIGGIWDVFVRYNDALQSSDDDVMALSRLV